MFNKENCFSEMQSSINAFSVELKNIRTGRVSPDILKTIVVDSYGSKTPLTQLSNINNLDNMTLNVNIWDSSLVKSIEKLHKDSYLKTIDASMSTFHDHIFSKIDIPTLILVGEKDKLTPPSMALKIHKLIKNSEFSIINEAGHLTNIENPKDFNNKVLQFLKKL